MKTRIQAIQDQKNPIIRAKLERMTDEQYAAHRAQLEAHIASGAVARAADRMAAEVWGKR